MGPPTYAHLGRACRDLLNNGYYVGLFKVDFKSPTDSGVDVGAGGTHIFEGNKVYGYLESSYRTPNNDFTYNKKTDTDGNLTAEVSFQDQSCTGLMVGLETDLNSGIGMAGGKLKTQYETRNATVDAAVDRGNDGSLLLNGSLVLGYQGLLCGFQMAYDTSQGKLRKDNFTVGYCARDFQVHTSIDYGGTFAGNLYHRVSPRLETGVRFAGTLDGDGSTRLEIGARYLLDPSTAVRAKVNNQSQVGLSIEHKLLGWATLTFSAIVNGGKDLQAGGHQVGLALELEEP